MRRADSHIHLFEHGFAGRYCAQTHRDQDLRRYEAYRLVHRIDSALVVGYEGKQRYEGNNEYILRLSHAHSWVFPLAYLGAGSAPSPNVIHSALAKGFCGFSVYLMDGADAEAFAAWPRATMRELADSRVVISMNASVEATTVIARAARDLAPSALLFSHLGLPGSATIVSPDQARGRLAPLLSLAGEPHIGVKISGQYAAEPVRRAYPHRNTASYVDVLAEAFGPRRLYWGSDFAPALDWISFDQAAHPYLPSSLAADERRQVLGGNLARLLSGLSSSAAGVGDRTGY